MRRPARPSAQPEAESVARVTSTWKRSVQEPVRAGPGERPDAGGGASFQEGTALDSGQVSAGAHGTAYVSAGPIPL